MAAYNYETLSAEASMSNIDIFEKPLRGRNKGFYSDGLIIIDKRMATIIEKPASLQKSLGTTIQASAIFWIKISYINESKNYAPDNGPMSA